VSILLFLVVFSGMLLCCCVFLIIFNINLSLIFNLNFTDVFIMKNIQKEQIKETVTDKYDVILGGFHKQVFSHKFCGRMKLQANGEMLIS